jgi:hypothetical protein
MDTHDNSDQGEATEPIPRQPATRALRRRSARDHFVEALATMSRFAEPKLNLAKLRQLMDLGDEEYATQATRIMQAIAAVLSDEEVVRFATCPHCAAPLEALSPDVAVVNLMTWQKAHPAYYQWSPYELKKLLDHLHQHPGHVLVPNFAQSCDIREPSGRTYTYLRNGQVK